MNEEMNEEWIKGFNDGYKMASSLGRPVKTEDFPKNFKHRSSYYDMGYASGVTSGHVNIIETKATNNVTQS